MADRRCWGAHAGCTLATPCPFTTFNEVRGCVHLKHDDMVTKVCGDTNNYFPKDPTMAKMMGNIDVEARYEHKEKMLTYWEQSQQRRQVNIAKLNKLVQEYGGWHNREKRYELFGIKNDHIGGLDCAFPTSCGAHLPPGIRVVLHEGIWWRVLVPNKLGGHKHRIQVLCPVCERWFSAGRIHQHAKKYEVK
jgi:hypothetical protein